MQEQNNMKNVAMNLHNDEDGLSTVEYIIILILIAVVAIGAWRNFGTAVEARVTEGQGEIDGL